MIHQIADLKIGYGDGATVFLFGDLQWTLDGHGFAEEAWEEFRKDFKSTPNAYAIGLGDYGDWLRPSMRAKIQSSASGDKSALKQMDDMVRRMQDSLLEKMEFLKGRLVGLHNGHHCWEFTSGDNSDMRLCSALKTSYLGWMASTRLVFTPPAKGQKGGFAHVLVSMHGTGSARFSSTDARWLEANIVPAWTADSYAKGHSCKSNVWSPFKRFDIRRRGPVGVREEIVTCFNVPGFNNGYTNGWDSSYVERAGFLPQAVGYSKMEFKIVKRHGATLAAGLKSTPIGKSQELGARQTLEMIGSWRNL